MTHIAATPNPEGGLAAGAATGAMSSQSWPWKVCIFLLAATLLSYLDRQALSVVAPVVSKELNLDNAQLGLLLSAFFYTYSLMHIFAGWILDRFNIRITYGLFVALWSLAQMACGIATGFTGLFTARLFLGAFEAAGQTGAARIIARILPKKDRAFANGIMMSGGSLGAAIAPVLMIWLANTAGWRTGFAALGVVGIVWAALWIAWFRPPAHVLYGPRGEGSRVEADKWSTIFRNPQFWSCIAGAAFTVPIIHISSAWVPTYFVQEWKLPLGAALSGYLFVIYIGLDLGFIGGGALVRFFTRGTRTVAGARKLVLLISAVSMLSAAAVPLARSAPLAVACVFLLNMGRASWGAIFLSFNQDISPGRVGTIAGVMGCIGAFSGALLVWAVGVISRSAGFDIPFLIIGVLAALGTIPLMLTKWEE
ncbi:MAG: MFS transporter [Bryobacteraceae bacterium]